MDIIDEISSDILTNALKNLSPEDKVGIVMYCTCYIDYMWTLTVWTMMGKYR